MEATLKDKKPSVTLKLSHEEALALRYLHGSISPRDCIELAAASFSNHTADDFRAVSDDVWEVLHQVLGE